MRELHSKIMGCGGEASGPIVAVFYDEPSGFDPRSAHYEVCVPVSGKSAGDKRIKAKELPVAQVATLIHIGPHRRMPSSFEKLTRWISENGYRITGPNREIYLAAPWLEGPRSPETYQAEIQFRVAR